MKALALLLAGCASAPITSLEAVPISTRGQGVCLGARVTPTSLVTARHCTEHGWSLSVDREPARVSARSRNDVAYLEVPPGPSTPVAAYSGESPLLVSTWIGMKSVRVTYVGPSWIELDLECLPGWSGSPVYSSRGLVAVVSRGGQGNTTCYAELIR
jgi:V8-like Glu-specific endopeptidase